MDARKLTPLRRQSRDFCFYGSKSSGKTLSMVYFAFLWFIRGKRVFSNFPLNFEHTLVNSLSDLRDIKSGVFLGDDLERWASSRFRSNTDKSDLLEVMLDFGKRSVDCYWSCKYPLAVDKGLRSTVDSWVSCNMVLKSNYHSLDAFLEAEKFLDNYFVQMDIYGNDLKLDRTCFLSNLELWCELYDTMTEIKEI